jgi:hypothetical protein
MLEKITTLIKSIQMLNISHPIINLVTTSIRTGIKIAETIVAALKLTTSLYIDGNRWNQVGHLM